MMYHLSASWCGDEKLRLSLTDRFRKPYSYIRSAASGNTICYQYVAIAIVYYK